MSNPRNLCERFCTFKELNYRADLPKSMGKSRKFCSVGKSEKMPYQSNSFVEARERKFYFCNYKD